MIRAGTLLEKERSQRPAPNQPGIPERQGRIVLLVSLPPHGGDLPGKEQAMKKRQRVEAMAEEVLARQARARAERTGEPFEEALEAVRKTEAGRQLEELREGPHRHERADQWQEEMSRERAEERHREEQG
jgi:hypothetical protein